MTTLNTVELATTLGISTATFSRYMKATPLPYTKTGRDRYFDLDEVIVIWAELLAKYNNRGAKIKPTTPTKISTKRKVSKKHVIAPCSKEETQKMIDNSPDGYLTIGELSLAIGLKVADITILVNNEMIHMIGNDKFDYTYVKRRLAILLFNKTYKPEVVKVWIEQYKQDKLDDAMPKKEIWNSNRGGSFMNQLWR